MFNLKNVMANYFYLIIGLSLCLLQYLCRLLLVNFKIEFPSLIFINMITLI